MPIDEAKLRKAAREAAYTSNTHLKEAQRRVKAARRRFTDGIFSGVGLMSWHAVGTHLERSRGAECGAAYQQLLVALEKAEEAVGQALRATARMDDAAR